MMIMKMLLLSMLSLVAFYHSMFGQSDVNNQSVEAVGSIVVYQTIKNTVPLSFSYHDVMFETLYQTAPMDPIDFDCRLLGVRHHPFERNLVVPNSIRVGIHSLHPVEMKVGCFQQTGIKSIDLRANIRTIPQNAFMFCDELKNVWFCEDSPHFIEASAFKGCTKLEKINFPARLRYIGDYAFDQCRSLSEIYLPKDLAYLGPYAFNYCTSLRKLTFATGHFRKIPERCFYNCEKLEHVEIPDGVDELGVSSFEYCGLKSIVLPATMRIINHNALSQNPLADIYCQALAPPQVGNGWTTNQLRAIRLHVPAAALNAYRDHPFWSNIPTIEPY